MQRVLSSREANSEYYNLDDEGIKNLKNLHDNVLKAISNPILKLDSIALIWMVKNDEE